MSEIKKEITNILSLALAGDKKYKYEDDKNNRSYVRWGKVKEDIDQIIDQAVKDKYLVFGGLEYYPEGSNSGSGYEGWQGYLGSFDTAEEAERIGKQRIEEDQNSGIWLQIVHDGKIIKYLNKMHKWDGSPELWEEMKTHHFYYGGEDYAPAPKPKKTIAAIPGYVSRLGLISVLGGMLPVRQLEPGQFALVVVGAMLWVLAD